MASSFFLVTLLALFYPPPVLAKTATGDLLGLYELNATSISTTSCPTTMRFGNFSFTQFSDRAFEASFEYFNLQMPHRDQKIGASSCNSSGAIWGAQSTHPARNSTVAMLDEWASGHGGNRSTLARKAFMDAAGDGRFIFGYDYVERTCGKSTIPEGTTYLWVQFDENVVVNDGLLLKENVKYMLLNHKSWGAGGVCVYAAVDVGSVSDDIDAGPMWDPSTEEDFVLPVDGLTQVDPGAVELYEEDEEPRNVTQVTQVDDSDVDFSGAEPEPMENNCFPGSAVVKLAGGGVKMMKELEVGDEVYVGRQETSAIFMFTHKQVEAQARFVTIETEAGESVTLTPGHYIYASGKLVTAASVVVGNTLTIETGANSAVVKTEEKVLSEGLFNPQTLHGDIIVDNVLASTYTTAVAPEFAHAVLGVTVRALYRTGLRSWIAGILHEGGGGLVERYTPKGTKVC